MRLIDLFCGAGGMGLGARRAGLDVALSVDMDPVLTSSYKANFGDDRLLLADLALTSGSALLHAADGRVDGVIGGPPCQGFSDIGRRCASDPRRQLLGHFFRIVAEIRPKFFVMENVRGLAYSDARGVLDEALACLRGRYEINGPIILDSADYGAATKRKRLFVIGVHKDCGDVVTLDDIGTERRPPANVRQAISDIASAIRTGEDDNGFDHWRIRKSGRSNSYAAKMRAPDFTFTGHRLIRHRPDVAERFASVAPGAIDIVGRHPRLTWSGQCPTLRAGTGPDLGSRQAVRPLHPDEPRVITVREAARLQGFPDSHRFHPTTWHSFRMIGNSVSPIIAEAIFRAVVSKLSRTSTGLIAAE